MRTNTGASEHACSYRRMCKFRNSVLEIHHLLTLRQGAVSGKEMAAIVGRSERQSREIFHAIIGESFRTARVRARLTPSQSLVRHSSVPISEIAERFRYN